MNGFTNEDQLRRNQAWLRLIVRVGTARESFDHLAKTGKPRSDLEETLVAMVFNLCLAECGFRVENLRPDAGKE